MKNQISKLAYAIRGMPSKRYLDYMRSPQWKQTREQHLESCDRWCQICYKAPAVQVHHWTYRRLGYELPQDLCAVCVRCHHEIHCSVYVPANDNIDQLALPLEESG